MSVGAVGSTAPIAATPGAVQVPGQAPASLLPAPNVGPCSVDALYVMLAENSDNQTKSSKASAERSHVDRQKALADYVDAMERQREAEEGGFLGDLGLDELSTVATVALGAAAIVATGGAAAVVVGLALSASAFAVQKTQCFGEDASKWVALGLGVVGGITTGVGLMTSTAQVSGTMKTVLRAVEIGAGATQIAVGAKEIEAAKYTSDADHAAIEGKEAQHRLARLDRWLDDVVEQMRGAQKSKKHGSEQLTAIKDTEAQTLLIATGVKA